MSVHHTFFGTGDLTLAFLTACENFEAASAELADSLNCWSVGDSLALVHAATGLVVGAASVLLRDVTLSWTCDRDLSSPHEVIRARCQCIAGFGAADPVGPGEPGSMGSAVSITSGAGGR